MTDQRASDIRFKIRRLLGHKQLNAAQEKSLNALIRELVEVECGSIGNAQRELDAIFKEHRHAPQRRQAAAQRAIR